MTELDASDAEFVPCHGGDEGASRGVPHLCRPVGRCGDDALSVRAHGNMVNSALVPNQLCNHFSARGVPDASNPILCRGNDVAAVRADGNGPKRRPHTEPQLLNAIGIHVKVARAAREGAAVVARALVSSWQVNEHGLDTLLARERYQRLHGLLVSGKMKVRVIPRDGDNVFVHGKAGVIEQADGRECAFVGSLNDSASGLRHAYGFSGPTMIPKQPSGCGRSSSISGRVASTFPMPWWSTCGDGTARRISLHRGGAQ